MEVNGNFNYFFSVKDSKSDNRFQRELLASLFLPHFNLVVVGKDNSRKEGMIMNGKFSNLPRTQEEIAKSYWIQRVFGGNSFSFHLQSLWPKDMARFTDSTLKSVKKKRVCMGNTLEENVLNY